MDSPGPAVEVMAGMAAAGATLVLFATGVGNPVGTPAAPTLKITGNPRTAAQAEENIDFSADEVLQGRRSTDEVGADLLALTLAVASGRLTYCEVLGDEEFAISRWEPSL